LKKIINYLQHNALQIIVIIFVNITGYILFLIWCSSLEIDKEANFFELIFFVIAITEIIISFAYKNLDILFKVLLLIAAFLWMIVITDFLSEWNQSKDLYKRFIKDKFDMSEYCNLNYKEKLVIESMSTYGITDCK